jgi:hypothetical protein
MTVFEAMAPEVKYTSTLTVAGVRRCQVKSPWALTWRVEPAANSVWDDNRTIACNVVPVNPVVSPDTRATRSFAERDPVIMIDASGSGAGPGVTDCVVAHEPQPPPLRARTWNV